MWGVMMRRRSQSAASFFKKPVQDTPKNIIFIDMLCLVKIKYLFRARRKVAQYNPSIVSLLKEHVPQVTLYVFNLIPDVDVEALIAEESGFPVFSGHTVREIITKASLNCRLPDEQICFIPMSRDHFDKIPEPYHKTSPTLSTGAWHSDDLERAMEAIKIKKSESGCRVYLDIDDSTVFYATSLYSSTTILNGHVVKLISDLSAAGIHIAEIVFLTSRASSQVMDIIPSLTPEELEQRRCIDVAVVAHHLNEALELGKLPHKVTRVLYSNGGLSDADFRKHSVLKNSDMPALFIDNSVDEIRQVTFFRRASVDYQHVLPPIRIVEHPELTSEHLAMLKEMCAAPALSYLNADNADSAVVLDHSQSCVTP